MVDNSLLLKTAYEREISGEKRLSTTIDRFVPYKKLHAKPLSTKSVCIPPTIKANLLTNLQNEMESRAEKIQNGEPGEKNTLVMKQSIIKRLHTASELVNRIPTCKVDPSMQNDDLKGVMSAIGTNYGDVDNIIQDILAKKDVKQETKIEKQKKSQETKVEKKAHELIKSGKATNEDEAFEIAHQTVGAPGIDDFIRERWFKHIKHLEGIAYDGVSSAKNAVFESPCGNTENFGSGKSGIQTAFDKLAFYGSKDDWKKFYLEGINEVEHDNGTFIRLNSGDKPGCLKEEYNKLYGDVL